MMEESTEKPNMPQSYKNIFNIPLYYNGLSLVFRYLSCAELMTVMEVCRVWSDIVIREIVRRNPCALMGGCKFHQDAPDFASWDTILSCIKKSSIKPTVGFVCIPITTKGQIKRRIFHELSKHCETIILFLIDFIAYDIDIDSFHLACAFLPETPNVKINTLKVTERNLKENDYEEYIDMLNKYTQNREIYAQLIIFYNGKTTAIAKKLRSLAKTSGGLDVIKDTKANWGIQYTNINNEKEDVVWIRGKKYYIDIDCCVALLITGSVDEYQTFISAKYKTEEQIEADLKSFRDQIKLKKHSVGFELGILDESYTAKKRLAISREIKLETTIFKTVFPEVPLIGIFESDLFLSVQRWLEKNYANEYQRKNMMRQRTKNKISTLYIILTYD